MPESKELLQESWARVLADGPAAAELFFARLVELDPQIGRQLRSVEPREHGRRFVEAATALVCGGRGVEMPAAGWADPRAELVGQALLWTVARLLGDGFTAEVRRAWREMVERAAAELHAAALGDAGAPRVVPYGARRLVQIGS